MKKIKYKLFIAIVFSTFSMLANVLFNKEGIPVAEMIVGKKFWISYLILFSIGYVLLGNIVLSRAQKNK